MAHATLNHPTWASLPTTPPVPESPTRHPHLPSGGGGVDRASPACPDQLPSKPFQGGGLTQPAPLAVANHPTRHPLQGGGLSCPLTAHFTHLGSPPPWPAWQPHPNLPKPANQPLRAHQVPRDPCRAQLGQQHAFSQKCSGPPEKYFCCWTPWVPLGSPTLPPGPPRWGYPC